jgi:hypothetical protein
MSKWIDSAQVGAFGCCLWRHILHQIDMSRVTLGSSLKSIFSQTAMRNFSNNHRWVSDVHRYEPLSVVSSLKRGNAPTKTHHNFPALTTFIFLICAFAYPFFCVPLRYSTLWQAQKASTSLPRTIHTDAQPAASPLGSKTRNGQSTADIFLKILAVP